MDVMYFYMLEACLIDVTIIRLSLFSFLW